MRRLRVEIYQSTYRGRWRWRYRIKAGNGEIIAHGESYQRRSGVEHVVDLLRSGMRLAIVEE